jgi:hypothetical protein
MIEKSGGRTGGARGSWSWEHLEGGEQGGGTKPVKKP